MGWFSGTPRLQRRVRDLEERCDTAERALKQLRAEWDDTYDKIRIAMARIVKRAAVVEAAEEPGKRELTPTAEPTSFNGRMLDDRQRAIQSDILRRRAGL